MPPAACSLVETDWFLGVDHRDLRRCAGGGKRLVEWLPDANVPLGKAGRPPPA